MPTIIQNFIRNTFVTALIIFWTIFSLISLIFDVRKYIRQPGNSFYNVFRIKNRPRTKVLDSNDWEHKFIQLSVQYFFWKILNNLFLEHSNALCGK